MSVLFDLAYNEFELLVKNHFGNELKLDNNQLRIVFDEIIEGNHGETIENIYNIVKSVSDETYTATDLVDMLLDTDLDVAVEYLIETDNYDTSLYISQDNFDELSEKEQKQNTLQILEDASKGAIMKMIDEANIEFDFIASLQSWKSIYDFGNDYRYID